MKKEEWIKWYLEKCPDCREDVIRFIADVAWHSGDEGCEIIEHLFAGGYCYYFAKMLEDAFGGTVCWHKGFGHIVWMDDNEICYDINGIFMDYGEGDMVPISELGDGLENFRHRKFNEE